MCVCVYVCVCVCVYEGVRCVHVCMCVCVCVYREGVCGGMRRSNSLCSWWRWPYLYIAL